MNVKVVLIKGTLAFLAALPFTVAQRLGNAGGILLYLFPNPLRKVVYCNIKHCFPQLSRKEQNRLVRKSLMSMMCSVTEYGAWWGWEPERVAPLIKSVTGEEHIQAAQKEGKGILILAPHLGSWEVAKGYIPSRYPCSVLYRPLRIRPMEAFIKNARQRGGSELLPLSRQGLREAYAKLDKGELVAILPDQVPGKRGGVFAPFFGLPAWTMTFAPKLAQKKQPAVFWGYGVRLGPGKGFNLHFEPVHPDIFHPDLTTAATAMNADIQSIVEKYPEQYQWTYKRFKVREPGCRNIYSEA
jgi:Kdo2-lipid IVA lauroyltransferase/acyltransferase